MAATVFVNCKVATMAAGDNSYGLIEDGVVAVTNDTITWVGHRDEIPSTIGSGEQFDLSGRLVTPGLIDCHTHVVFGGNRAREFEMRLEGRSYEEIARAGGGILSTMRATREMGEEELLRVAVERVDVMLANGVTTIEIKSGYGLDVEQECKMLRVARRLEAERPVNVRTSWLAAHALPPESRQDADGYIERVAIGGLSIAHGRGLVDAVDAFCESIAFTASQTARLFDVAAEMGLPVKLHADQLSDMGGGELAARYRALSADHLEFLNPDGIRAMHGAGTVAVLLPGACYTLGQEQHPPVYAMRKQGVPMAVATDCNPGSSPLHSLLLALNMACIIFGLTPEEALAGATRNAAMALGDRTRGVIREGCKADLAIWNVEHPAELVYRVGASPLENRILAGVSC